MPTRVLFLLISHVTHGYNAVRGHMTGSDNSRAEEYLCVCVRACVRVCVLCVVCVCSHETVLSSRLHPAHPVSALVLDPRGVQALWSQTAQV